MAMWKEAGTPLQALAEHASACHHLVTPSRLFCSCNWTTCNTSSIFSFQKFITINIGWLQ
jgi:hypothetical protein